MKTAKEDAENEARNAEFEAREDADLPDKPSKD